MTPPPAPGPDGDTSPYVTSDQIAGELGVHPQTVRRYFRDGGLPGRKIGKQWTTTRAAFDSWLLGARTYEPGFPDFATIERGEESGTVPGE